MTTTIASAQMASVWGDPEATLGKAGGYIKAAADAGASLIAFPEQFATGWSPRPLLPPEGEDGRVSVALKDLARRCGIAVIGAYTERFPPLPRNTCIAISPGGEVAGHYAKIHLFSPAGEERGYSAGDTISVIEVDGVRFGIAICYDLRFPGLFQMYAEAGADAVIIPAAWPASRIEQWELLIRARALEMRLFVAGVNTTGTTPVERYCGNSLTAGPDGRVIARAGSGEEILFSSLDPAEARAARARDPVPRDRRPDVYRTLCGR